MTSPPQESDGLPDGATPSSSTGRRRRIFVSQQGCIPLYRKSFFARLNIDSDMDFVVVHGRAPSGTDILEASPPFEFPNIEVHNRELRVLGRTFIWQPVLRRVMHGEFDAAVIGEEVKYLSNIAVALALYVRGRPFLLWGFGYHQYDRSQTTHLARLTAAVARRLKRFMHGMASGYLVYTSGGRTALLSAPDPPRQIAVLQNTIDTEREDRFRSIVAAETIQRAIDDLEVRSSSIKLLYFGRLVATKQVDLLVQYARRSLQSRQEIDVMIFGQGTEEARLRELARGLDNVRFYHHDDLKLARALKISAAVVIPGYVGLAVTHGFLHGVPVLTRHGQLHSPEVEYIEDGINGLMLPESPDAFFEMLDEFVRDHALQKKLAEGAKRTGRTMDMNRMVGTFRELVSNCLIQSCRRSGK